MEEGEFGTDFGRKGFLVGSVEGRDGEKVRGRRKESSQRSELPSDSRSPMSFSFGPLLSSFISKSVPKVVSKLWWPNGKELTTERGEREGGREMVSSISVAGKEIGSNKDDRFDWKPTFSRSYLFRDS